MRNHENHETEAERQRRIRIEERDAPPAPLLWAAWATADAEEVAEEAAHAQPGIWARFLSRFLNREAQPPAAAEDLDVPFFCTHDELILDMRQPASSARERISA